MPHHGFHSQAPNNLSTSNVRGRSHLCGGEPSLGEDCSSSGGLPLTGSCRRATPERADISLNSGSRLRSALRITANPVHQNDSEAGTASHSSPRFPRFAAISLYTLCGSSLQHDLSVLRHMSASHRSSAQSTGGQCPFHTLASMTSHRMLDSLFSRPLRPDGSCHAGGGQRS